MSDGATARSSAGGLEDYGKFGVLWTTQKAMKDATNNVDTQPGMEDVTSGAGTESAAGDVTGDAGTEAVVGCVTGETNTKPGTGDLISNAIIAPEAGGVTDDASTKPRVGDMTGDAGMERQLRRGAELRTSLQRSSAKRGPIGTSRRFRPCITSCSSDWYTAATSSPLCRRGNRRRVSTTQSLYHKEGPAERFKPCRILSGTQASHSAGVARGSRTSCSGVRTPLRLNRRRMAAHARVKVATSSVSCWLASM
jgi:hypothetical protein